MTTLDLSSAPEDLDEVDELRGEDRQHGADALLADGRGRRMQKTAESPVEHVLKLRLECLVSEWVGLTPHKLNAQESPTRSRGP